MSFKKAVRQQAYLRLAITGPSGSGKTLGALMIAKGMGFSSIGVIDTERGSSQLYADSVRLANGSVWKSPEFVVCDINPPYTPEKFIDGLHDAAKAGIEFLIIDSMTHEWNGEGGCLELVDVLAKSKFQGNGWAAWSEVTPRHRKFVDAIIAYPGHIVCTMRSKTETEQQVGANGKRQVVKLGMKAEQRDATDYEFTTVLDLTHDGHFASVSKDRTGVFAGDPKPITEKTGEDLLVWLKTGATPTPAPVATQPAPPATEQTPEQKAFNAWAKTQMDAGTPKPVIAKVLAAVNGNYIEARRRLEMLYSWANPLIASGTMTHDDVMREVVSAGGDCDKARATLDSLIAAGSQ